MGFFEKVKEFFKNEPNLKALFKKVPKSTEQRPLSGADRIRMRNKRNAFFFLFVPLAVLYMEIVVHFSLFGGVPFDTLILLLLFSFSFGFFINGIALLMPLKTNRIFTLSVMIAVTLLVISQYVYNHIFGQFYAVSLMGMAGDAITNFTGMLIEGLSDAWFGSVLIVLPLILFIKNYKKYSPAFSPTFSFRIYILVFSLLLHLLAVGIVGLDKKNAGAGNYYYYNYEINQVETSKRFGILTGMRRDIHAMLFGMKTPEVAKAENIDTSGFKAETTTTESGETDDPNIPEEEEGFKNPNRPDILSPNVMDIDFNALIEEAPNDDIKSMHEYFASVTPTMQNEYTALFKGKNLIVMTLEGFSYKTIDPERTPMLYKMANEGFVFKNFYTSLWGGSTATGEYAAMTGNFHSNANCLAWSGDKLMPFTFGNQFAKIGYKTYAFHNNDYTYYNRHLSHPNMGYEFIGIGNGLEKATDKNGDTMLLGRWPHSDRDMARVTLPYYIDSEEPFCVYYMTVSGHAEYNFIGNNMAMTHRDIVEGMDCSETLKAYHASQYEVELMLVELVTALQQAGKLEDTVFVMTSDHYPYGLSNELLGELYGLPAGGIRSEFDLLRNSFILWSASMEEPIVVEKPCSAIDIVPTVSNLFGLEYDSRLLMGTDVLSDSDPLVVLNCLFDGPSWCWMTQYGSYNSRTKQFTLAEGYEADDEFIANYVKQMNKLLHAKQTYSPRILEKDYYRYVFK